MGGADHAVGGSTSSPSGTSTDLRQPRVRLTGLVPAVIDEVGVGAGDLDRLNELGLPVTGFNAGGKADDPEAFLNARAEAYWHLRERFEQGEVDLDPNDDELAAQLCAIKWDVDSRGRVRVERKEDMRRRGLPSPTGSTQSRWPSSSKRPWSISRRTRRVACISDGILQMDW